ncbi:hypothetical protein ACFQVA_14775 [Actinomadura keratinilytica]
MASHRKPRFRKLAVNLPAPGRLTPGASLRTATATALALAGAAGSVVAGAPVAQAAPGPTTAQVKAQVDRLHREAEIATEKYNGAKEKADKAEQRLGRSRTRPPGAPPSSTRPVRRSAPPPPRSTERAPSTRPSSSS